MMNNQFKLQCAIQALQRITLRLHSGDTSSSSVKGNSNHRFVKHQTTWKSAERRSTGRTHQNSLARIDQEADELQRLFTTNRLNPRDQFGSLSTIKMPQPEPFQKPFQPDIWNQGQEMIRVVKEREKTFREKLDDEFAEGRVAQITEPLRVTVKQALIKAERLAKWRIAKREAVKKGLPIPPPPKVQFGILTAKIRAERKRKENAPNLELVPKQLKPQNEKRVLKAKILPPFDAGLQTADGEVTTHKIIDVKAKENRRMTNRRK